jgi:AraC family transcriptional regulator
LPFATLDALADQASVPRINELRYVPGIGIFDNTIKHIGLSLLPALRTPENVSRLFTDHVALALAVHTAQTYGGMQTISKPLKGGLSPW